MKNSVFILSLFDTGYYAARQLKSLDCQIWGFDYNTKNAGFFSSFIKSFECPHPINEEKKLLAYILEKRKSFKMKPVLIVASEPFVFFVNQHKEILIEYFLFIQPKKLILDEILDKERQLIMSQNSCLNIAPLLKWDYYSEKIPEIHEQYIIRAADQIKWKNNLSEKAILVNNKSELEQAVLKLKQKDISFICQQVIQGGIINNFEYNALMIDGKIIHSHIIQKLQQYPFGFGAACAVKVVENEHVDNMGRKFVLENGVEGFSNTEFKFDPETEKYYFIETNPRVWQQIELTSAIGDNIMQLYYSFLTEGIIEGGQRKTNIEKLWIDLPSILLLYKKYSKESVMTLGKLLKYLFKADNYGLLKLTDIKPFLKTVLLK